MAGYKLIKKLKRFYHKSFTTDENEITFDSFIKFPVLFLNLLLFNFEKYSEDGSLKIKFIYYMRKFPYVASLLCCGLLFIQYSAYGYVNSANFDVLVRSASGALTTFLIFAKVSTMFARKDDIRSIFMELDDFFKCHKEENGLSRITNYLKKYHHVVKMTLAVFISTMTLSFIPWVLFLINGTIVYLDKVFFPFDAYRAEMFPFATLWLNLLAYVCFAFLLGSDLLLFTLVTVISMEFDFLSQDMKRLGFQTKDERKVKIVNLIDRHNKLFEISDKLQNIFGISFLITFVCSSLILCFVSFHFLTAKAEVFTSAVDILYFGTIAYQIWQPCYIGQRLTDSSSGIAHAIYETNWTESYDKEFNNQIIIILCRAQKPKTLNAMGFAPFSLETFAKVR